jgi:hypothetical protein
VRAPAFQKDKGNAMPIELATDNHALAQARPSEHDLELVGYQWGGCLYRLEETFAYHRDEGRPLYAPRETWNPQATGDG